MNIKTYLFALIASSICLATGMDSPLQAQTDKTSAAPLSFKNLGTDQAIKFFVSAKHTPFSVAPVVFEVEISGQPPEAKIRLLINASMQISEAEKAWGHHVNEKITRSLKAEDLQTLENFLNDHRAKGALARPSSTTSPAMEFDLVNYRMAKEGFKHSEVGQKEFYNPSEDAERSFVKNFIGFNGAN